MDWVEILLVSHDDVVNSAHHNMPAVEDHDFLQANLTQHNVGSSNANVDLDNLAAPCSLDVESSTPSNTSFVDEFSDADFVFTTQDLQAWRYALKHTHIHTHAECRFLLLPLVFRPAALSPFSRPARRTPYGS